MLSDYITTHRRQEFTQENRHDGSISGSENIDLTRKFVEV